MDLMGEALARHRAGCLAEAEELYRRILAMRPAEADVLSNRASALLGLGRPSEALACCEAALVQNPAHSNAMGNLGNALMALGRPAEALECYQALLAQDSYVAHPWNSCGNALRALGRLDEAEQHYTHAIALDPAWPLALMNRSRLRLQRGRAAAALKDVGKAATLLTASAELHTHRAAVLFAMGDWPATIAACDAALAFAPGSHVALAQKADALLRLERCDEALACYDQALALAPAHGPALRNRAVALRLVGDAAGALAACEFALARDPGDPDAGCTRATLMADQGKHADALAALDAVLAEHPAHAPSWCNRGQVLRVLGKLEDGLASCDRAIALDPGNVPALIGKGTTLLDLSQAEAALAAFDAALALQPDTAEGLIGRGIALRALRRLEDALACNQQAVARHPDSGLAAMNTGVVLLDLRRPQEALPYIEQAVELMPLDVLAQTNHAVVLHALQRPVEALAACERALAIDCDVAIVYANQGCVYADLNRNDEAMASYAAALTRDADCTVAHFGLAVSHLLTGNFAEGWAEYEWRWQHTGREPMTGCRPQWRGEDLAGKTILVLAEQGLGDVLQFVRLLPMLQARGASVVAAVPRAVMALMPKSRPGLCFIDEGQPLPPHDTMCPMLSVPLGLGLMADTIPATVPYLNFEPAWSEPWLARLGPKTRPRIGVAWSGNKGHVNDANRSIPLARFATLFGQECDCEVISVQPEVRATDEPAMAAWPALRDVRSELTSFEATAGLVATLDLVISVDTSVAHLAGGLGLPVWILLPFAPDWRWLMGRDDSPWYPTARLWRQHALGDWNGVFAAIRRAINGLATSAAYNRASRTKGRAVMPLQRWVDRGDSALSERCP